jgi:cell division protein FtsL
MNNMKYCNDSLAHDFDMFMPREKKQNHVVVELPKKSKQKPKAKSSVKVSSKLFSIIVTVFLVGAAFGCLFLHAEISKVSNELNAVEAETVKLKSEQTRLNVILEKKTSVGNLENQAKKLGMQKQEKTQVNYIFNYQDENTEYSADID